MKPVIAVTPEAIHLPGRFDGRGAFCGVSYSQAIELVGGIPVIVPLTKRRAVLDHFLDNCAGLLLTGGGDVSFKFYTPRRRAKISGVDEVRDEMEIYLVRAALKRELPVLAICRGIQVLNVALGGTLIADLPGHRNPQPDALCDALTWTADSRMRKLLGRAPGKVNTSHHQALGVVAAPLRVVARSADGVIEAVEHKTARLCWGVQFHPERLVYVAPQFRRLFRALVSSRPAARTRRSAGGGV
ncbi:MAG: putative glutamine amidotransferase [Verrucomicrobiae bacterium]|nr:putative glutamine amidotransferase [Verrucomicrobiae bacterium]